MDFIEFIKNYWQYLSVAVIVILDILILIYKRVKFNIRLPESTYAQLMDLINDAEEIYGSGHGKEKMNYVLQRYVKENNVVSGQPIIMDFIQSLVEMILETPHKKGGVNREED